jgi:hypothetical protein
MIAMFGPLVATFASTTNVDVTTNSFSTAHDRWRDIDLGNVVFARVDGKLLLREQLEALCIYCKEVAGPMLMDAVAGVAQGDSVRRREEASERMAKQYFLEFFQEFKTRKAREMGAKKRLTVPSPYD